MREGASPIRAQRSGPIGRLIFECVERVAAPDVAISVIDRALEVAVMSSLPEEPAQIAELVSALVVSLSETLDAAAAQAVRDDLARMLPFPLPERTEEGADDPSSSGTRIKPERGDPTPRRIERRVVVVACELRALSRALRVELAGEAHVLETDGVYELATMLERNRVDTLVVGPLRGLEGPMLTTLARLLPRGATVVLCGVERPDGLEGNVVSADSRAPVREVARLCLAPAPRAAAATEKPRVVIAAADSAWRAVLADWIERDGYSVFVCDDGFVALEACIEQPPVIVVADLTIVSVGAAELARLVRSRFRDRSPPIVFVSDGAAKLANEVVIPIAKGQPPTRLLQEIQRRAPITP